MKWLRKILTWGVNARARAIYYWLRRPTLPTRLSRRLRDKLAALRVQRELKLARKRHDAAMDKLVYLTSLNRKRGVHWCIHRLSTLSIPYTTHSHAIEHVPADLCSDGNFIQTGYARALEKAPPISVLKPEL
jgi:hypothetical protein